MDRAGARALTGGEDYQLRMFDFGGMKRDMRAFRKLEPSEGYPVNAVSFSPTGASFASMLSGSAESKPACMLKLCLHLSRRALCIFTGDAFLVVTGSSQPKIYDRDGHELGEFVKGDMYIRDLRNTKGHLYRCCAGQWHPDDRFAECMLIVGIKLMTNDEQNLAH